MVVWVCVVLGFEDGWAGDITVGEGPFLLVVAKVQKDVSFLPSQYGEKGQLSRPRTIRA